MGIVGPAGPGAHVRAPGEELRRRLLRVELCRYCGHAERVLGLDATNTVSLKSSTSAYLWAYVTSPTTAADGNYPLTFTVTRAGTSGPSSSYTSYYKGCSSDSTDPTLFWNNPGQGQTITGRSYTFTVSSSDDHAVKKIDLYMDDPTTPVSSTACDDITYICQLTYNWSVGAPGPHTAIFRANDWKGNFSEMRVNFTVS